MSEPRTLGDVLRAIWRARALPAFAFLAWFALAVYSFEATLDCVPDWIDGRKCDHAAHAEKRKRDEIEN
jgi:hypothetical protein